MKKTKKEVKLEYLASYNIYQVVQVKNSLEVTPGNDLTPGKVQELIDKGFNITINPKK